MPTITTHVRQATVALCLSGLADGVYVRINSVEAGPVSAGANDAATAVAVADAVNAHPGMALLASASASGSVVTLTAAANGSAGNGLVLDVEAVTAGDVILSAPYFSGGVTVAISH